MMETYIKAENVEKILSCKPYNLVLHWITGEKVVNMEIGGQIEEGVQDKLSPHKNKGTSL